MPEKQKISLSALKEAVLKEFEINAHDFGKGWPSAVGARKAFVLIARGVGFNNSEIASDFPSKRGAHKVSQTFTSAMRLKKSDPSFASDVYRICTGLNITLDND